MADTNQVEFARTVKLVFKAVCRLPQVDLHNYRVACAWMFADDERALSNIEYLFDELENYHENRTGNDFSLDYLHQTVQQLCNTSEDCEKLVALFKE